MRNPHRIRTAESRVNGPCRAAAVVALGLLVFSSGGSRATEPPSPLTGRWQAAITVDEKQQRRQAIEEATANMRPMMRSKARSRLSERTSPPRFLVLEIESPKVMIGSGEDELELELGGVPIEVSGKEGKARVSAKMEGERLIVVARTGKGERTTAYRVNGARLTVEVTMTGSELTGPLQYVTTYARKE